MQQIAAFGGSYLFGLLLLHLLPELFTSSHEAEQLGIALLIGFAFQLLLDFISKGAAHGHLHQVVEQEPTEANFYYFPLLFALCMHALVEGLLLGLHQGDLHLGVAILLHKLPAAATLTLMMGNMQKRNVFFGLLCFSLATPLGWGLGAHLQYATWFPETMLHLLNAFAMGNLLHLATTMLLEADPNHQLNSVRALLMVVGMGTALLTAYH